DPAPPSSPPSSRLDRPSGSIPRRCAPTVSLAQPNQDKHLWRIACSFFPLFASLTLNCKLLTVGSHPMHWLERKIRRYEHRRWTTDDNRRVQPFRWGLEHIGGDPADTNPAEYVRQYAKYSIEHSPEWF